VTIYRFKDASHLSRTLDPQAVGNRLDALRHNGHGFTPEAVVADARKKTSPFHDAFTWDDTVAAGLHRLTEAGYLIRNVVTVVQQEGGDREVRAFLPVTMEDVPDDQRYVSIEVAMSNEDYRSQVLNQALSEMIALRRKYQDFQELARIFRAIDATAKRMKAA
jgi:hypothetical protein